MHLHSKVYTLKIINVNLVLYLLIIDKSKTAAVHPNEAYRKGQVDAKNSIYNEMTEP